MWTVTGWWATELPRRRDGVLGVLGLPLIANRKAVDPSDPSTPDVLQLESAMGAAIGVFEAARALRVPRRRFAPAGAPSLAACDRLKVFGDVSFGRGVSVRGSVVIEQRGAEQLTIDDNAVLAG